MPGADMGPAGNHLRAKRRTSQIGYIKAKAARGETTGNERALVRMGRQNTLIITGQDDLSSWTDDELRLGQKKDKNGKTQGRPPVVVPKALHDELVRRTLNRANEMMRESLEDAIRVLVELATSEVIEAKDRLRAINMIMERVMGKSPERVEISGNAPWLVALQAGIVNVDQDTIDVEDDIEDAEWEDE